MQVILSLHVSGQDRSRGWFSSSSSPPPCKCSLQSGGHYSHECFLVSGRVSQSGNTMGSSTKQVTAALKESVGTDMSSGCGCTSSSSGLPACSCNTAPQLCTPAPDLSKGVNEISRCGVKITAKYLRRLYRSAHTEARQHYRMHRQHLAVITNNTTTVNSLNSVYQTALCTQRRCILYVLLHNRPIIYL